MKEYWIFTHEHRKYLVKANSWERAVKYLSQEANLEPKDRRVKLEETMEFDVLQE